MLQRLKQVHATKSHIINPQLIIPPMKYLLTLAIIVIAVTAGTLMYNWPKQHISDKDILVTVNGHSLPKSLLAEKKSLSGYHSKDDQTIVDTIIINELLIQEAQKRGIDREPKFRSAVQEYYEQSLIKILIDRQFSDVNIEATDDEVDRYIANFGKFFTFTRLIEDKGEMSKIPEQRSLLFDDLSDSLKLMLGNMKVGDVVTDYFTGNEVISFRLDKIEPAPGQEPFHGNRDAIRKIITNYKKEKALTAWIKKLRDQAKISFPNTTGTP